MFELPEITTLHVTKTHARKEWHGEDLVQAVTVRLRWETTNHNLKLLMPGLYEALYFNAAREAGQASIDQVPEGEPNLRCPKLVYPLKLDLSYQGHTLKIEYGINDDSAIWLRTAKVDKFSVNPREGGSVEIEWNVGSNVDISKEVVGDLYDLEGGEIEATMLAPVDTGGAVIDGTKGHPGAAAAGDDSQAQLGLDADDDDHGPEDTYSEAGTPGAKGESWPFPKDQPQTPEQALADAVGSGS